MTDKILYVDVPMFCSRKKKEYSVRLPIDEARELAAKAERKATAAKALDQQIQTIPDFPDCLLYYKGQAVILANVDARSDDAIRRALNLALGENVFPVPESKPRAAKSSETKGEG